MKTQPSPVPANKPARRTRAKQPTTDPTSDDATGLIEQLKSAGVPLTIHVHNHVAIHQRTTGTHNAPAVNYHCTTAPSSERELYLEAENARLHQQVTNLLAVQNQKPDAAVGQDFIQQLRAVCDAHGMRSFALYGRLAQCVSAEGNLLPAQPMMVYDQDPILLEEAVYYLDRQRETIQNEADAEPEY